MLELAGLTSTEESIYLTLLDLPPVTLNDAYQACSGMSRGEVQAVLDALTDKGMLTQMSQRPRRYAPVAPEAALQAHLGKREEELRQARAAVCELSQRYRAIPRQTATDELAEIVTGKRRTWQRWFGSLASATSQVRVLNRPPFEAESESEDVLPAESEVLQRGLPVRVVYDESGVRNPTVIARRRAEHAAGEQARITTEVPVHLLLIDDNLALMPLGRDRLRTDGLLVVRPCALLDALSALFELIWAGALPLNLDPPALPDGQPLALRHPTARTIIGLLAAGLSDQAIARRLDCSERTIQRHVLKLTEAVGATTRFQAGLHIGRRNWLT